VRATAPAQPTHTQQGLAEAKRRCRGGREAQGYKDTALQGTPCRACLRRGTTRGTARAHAGVLQARIATTSSSESQRQPAAKARSWGTATHSLRANEQARQHLRATRPQHARPRKQRRGSSSAPAQVCKRRAALKGGRTTDDAMLVVICLYFSDFSLWFSMHSSVDLDLKTRAARWRGGPFSPASCRRTSTKVVSQK